MADESQKPPAPPPADRGADAAAPVTPAKAAADKPAGGAPGEPLKGEVSRTDSPGAGVSAAPVAPPRADAPAPKPANPAAAQTATTSETSSATGAPTPAAVAGKPPASAASSAGAPSTNAAARAAAPAAGAPARPAAAAPGSAAKPAAPAAAKPAAAPHPPAAPAPPSGPTEPPPPAGTAEPPFIATLRAAIAGAVEHVSYYVGDWTIVVPVAQLAAVARHLKTAPDALFDFCSDITAVDWPPRKDARFDLVYALYSTRLRHRVRVKVRASETTPVPSMSELWAAANWLEREVYDMFGVNITGHPDRRRILMPEDWQGYPQRKDYPLEGPGELLMENPIDWLKLRQARDEADIE